ncbi:CehA/McbA family metallohydrolase [Thermodesulfobacteriota bacterium]
MDPDFKFEYVGNIHIHSSYSDGAGTIPEIAACAKNLGIDFVATNEHDHMADGLHLETEGFYDGILALAGLEIGVRYHHYLSFDLKEMPEVDNTNPQDVIDEVNRQGGFGFLAHPMEKGMPFVENSIAYTWNDLQVKDYTGIEIWNFSSRWKERVKSPIHGIYHLIFKASTLKGPDKETLKLWDRLCQERKTVGVGGSDAHGAKFKWAGTRFTPLSYSFLLNSINIHILMDKKLSDDFSEAKSQVYDAIKNGRLYVAHNNLKSAKGFRFYFSGADNVSVVMGQDTSFEKGTLFAESPCKGEISILRNGKIIKKVKGQKTQLEVEEPGVYRVEVYLRKLFFGLRPWIFSNPIYLI